MTTEQTTAAARLILSAGQRAAAAAGDRAGFSLIAVNLRPGDPMKGNPAAVLLAWTAGPVWGELKIEFKRYPMHLIPVNNPQGLWVRVNGTAVTPAGLPLMPKLSALLTDIATAAAGCANVHLPRGCHYVAAAE